LGNEIYSIPEDRGIRKKKKKREWYLSVAAMLYRRLQRNVTSTIPLRRPMVCMHVRI